MGTGKAWKAMEYMIAAEAFVKSSEHPKKVVQKKTAAFQLEVTK